MKINNVVIYSGGWPNWKNASIWDTLGERYMLEFKDLSDWSIRENDGKVHLLAPMDLAYFHKFVPLEHIPSSGYEHIPRMYLWNESYLEVRKEEIVELLEGDDAKSLFVKHNDKTVYSGRVIEPWSDSYHSDIAELRYNTTYVIAPVRVPAVEARVWVIDGEVQRTAVYLRDDVMFDAIKDRLSPLSMAYTSEHLNRTLGPWARHHRTDTYSFDIAIDSRGDTKILEVHLPYCIGDYGGFSYELYDWFVASTRFLDRYFLPF